MRQKEEEPSSIGNKAKGPEWFDSLRYSMRSKKEKKNTNYTRKCIYYICHYAFLSMHIWAYVIMVSHFFLPVMNISPYLRSISLVQK